jgi:hypothetical protein
MLTPTSTTGSSLPSALDVATHAVALLEDNPLFNAGHGAVFTRDGLNELEASVMVSRGGRVRPPAGAQPDPAGAGAACPRGRRLAAAAGD